MKIAIRTISTVSFSAAGVLFFWAVSNPLFAQCEEQFFPTGGESGKSFGFSVDQDGDTMVIGFPRGGEPGERGAAHVYRWVDSSWVFETRLSSDDNNNAPFGGWGQFAWSVAVSGSRIVVGCPDQAVSGGGSNVGAVYVYRKVGSNWG